jgi:hypothetical protein
MLTLTDPDLGRRDFLRIGGLGLGGLSLPGLLAARDGARRAGRPLADRSVVFLFLHGGPPQTETFDPKMDAPAGVRSVVGEVPTTLPGVTFGAAFPKLARWAHRLAIVRSFKTGDGNHDLKPLVGRDTGGANLGSVCARIRGANHPVTGMPANVALFPRAVDAEAQPATQAFGRFDASGSLGAAYAPFVPGEGGAMQEDMQLRLPRSRLDDRRRLLGVLDDLRLRLESGGTLDGVDRFRAQAYDVILGGAARAFDLAGEDPRIVARYDTAPLVRAENIRKRWNNHKNYLDNARSLGKLMLLARRLAEAGCGFITVTTNFVWDLHADDNNATIEEGMDYVGLPFDHAVSAFIEDVEARGLSDRILLIACGEMGRTPKVNKQGGRDHWGGLAPLLIYGGGLEMGQVIGRSTKDAGEPASEPVGIPNLIATVLHALFDVGRLRLASGLPPEILRLAESARPIEELF